MAPGPSATFVFDTKLTDYAALDVNVLISFTRNSLLIKRRQVRCCLLSWCLHMPCTAPTRCCYSRPSTARWSPEQPWQQQNSL